MATLETISDEGPCLRKRKEPLQHNKADSCPKRAPRAQHAASSNVSLHGFGPLHANCLLGRSQPMDLSRSKTIRVLSNANVLWVRDEVTRWDQVAVYTYRNRKKQTHTHTHTKTHTIYAWMSCRSMLVTSSTARASILKLLMASP